MHRGPTTGLLHWTFPAMLLVGALAAATSGRDLTQSFSDLQAIAEPTRPTILVWVQRAVSLLLLLAALEQILNHIALQRRTPSPTLLAAFIAFWVGTIGAPAVLGAHPAISHELLYAPAVGIAACLVGASERDRILHAARDALMVLMLAGLLAVAVRPTLVLDPSYDAGLLAGVPRFAGLTPHAVTQGSLAQGATLLLWAFPYRHRWTNRAAWALTLGVLLIAQSKAAWIACGVCLGAMAAVRHGNALRRGLADPRQSQSASLMLVGLGAIVLASTVAVIVGDAGTRVSDFLESPEGARMATLTGRDRIWAIAAQEWSSHPVFGYGLTLWDAAYRARIDLPHATHAHNQFMDDAARAGSVGVIALVVYAAVLLVMSVRYARATGGLSIAFFLSLALRAVSEVPLTLLGYGSELFMQGLFLVILSATTLERPARRSHTFPLRYGVVR
jgi:O-antigen ligase